MWYNTITINERGTKMYRVVFVDEVHGENCEEFNSFDEAVEYWNSYADTETCIEGELIDLEDGEVIWSF